MPGGFISIIQRARATAIPRPQVIASIFHHYFTAIIFIPHLAIGQSRINHWFAAFTFSPEKSAKHNRPAGRRELKAVQSLYPAIYKKDNGLTGNTHKQQQALPGYQ